tara:strand:+ start:3120 stop:3389 length:270 start_codon:yes stop_codon:yes gene_type:complete
MLVGHKGVFPVCGAIVTLILDPKLSIATIGDIQILFQHLLVGVEKSLPIPFGSVDFTHRLCVIGAVDLAGSDRGSLVTLVIFAHEHLYI